jgi:hypothetical protein
MKNYLCKVIHIFKKGMSLFLIVSLLVQAGCFTTFAQSVDLTEKITYSMEGTDVIENMEFIDTDGARVVMNRVIHINGTAVLTITKNGKSTVEHLKNHDYNMFYALVNSSSENVDKITHNNELLRGGDIIGSQYKHVYISSNSYTFTNSAIEQIAVSGVSTAAGILMGALGLPGATALAIAGFVYTVITALAPYKVEINQTLYEVLFSYDNAYYTHCYQEIIKSYDTGNHLIDTRTEYHQSIGG